MYKLSLTTKQDVKKRERKKKKEKKDECTKRTIQMMYYYTANACVSIVYRWFDRFVLFRSDARKASRKERQRPFTMEYFIYDFYFLFYFFFFNF